MNYDIEINELEKSFDEVKALRKTSFNVESGDIFGLIGPDGAGKTTLIRMLTTLISPDSGSAKVRGFDIIKDFREIRNIIGYMPGRFALYQDLTIEENLDLFAKIFDTSIEENYDLIKPIYSQIEPFKNRRAGNLSGGMKQKLALSCALIHKPELLFLDEPTTGVDPVSRKEFWDMLAGLKEIGITIFVSTPYMDEAILCDKIALIQDGNIMNIDKPENISKSFTHNLYSIISDNMYMLLNILRSYKKCNTAYAFGESCHFTFKDDSNDIDELKRYLDSNKVSGYQIKEIEAGIEDSFMDLMVKNDE